MAEKHEDIIAPAPSHSSESISGSKPDLENEGEVFKRGEGYEDFRTVSWVQTTVILLKSKYNVCRIRHPNGFLAMYSAHLGIQSSLQPVCLRFLRQCTLWVPSLVPST